MAYLNIEGVSTMPQNRNVKRLGYLEVLDDNGHYFRKHIILRGQGNYSIRFPKKCFSAVFCETNWSEDNTTEISIGNWVDQDMFHFKAFYTDFTRGIGEIGYKLFDDVVADRDPYWVRGGYDKENDKARCYPDGFPCAVYLNGKFYGLFAWQLKKSRKNMNMKKRKSQHIHLDGNLRNSYIFQGNIEWTSFEVRNPDTLYTMNNNVYDGDSPKELMDENSVYYNIPTDSEDLKEIKRRTAQTKASIVNMSNYYQELFDMDSLGISEEDFRTEFEKRYDVEGLLDYYVFYKICMNGDGTIKNWQWFTYDGARWTVTPYDLDQILGLTLYGFYSPAIHSKSIITQGPFLFVNKYYYEDERQRYFELRDKKVFSEENILSHVYDWINRVGDKYYEMEEARWPDSPCYNEVECNENWELYENWVEYDSIAPYSSVMTYTAGDICKYEGRMWIATNTSKGVIPVKRNSAVDSIER
ncbi:MAG: CotH kinase family protein, partial [Bacteroidaceae bacterium]|nr:CotH kinase family protein [Bacteroidaceae bacterium]